MASNCPYWQNKKCAPPGIPPDHDCSWPEPKYHQCAMYKVVAVKSAGGSMEDQMHGAGMIPPGATVVGGRGRRLTDTDVAKIVVPRKWWQFWK